LTFNFCLDFFSPPEDMTQIARRRDLTQKIPDTYPLGRGRRLKSRDSGSQFSSPV
jgi:hypothetical protein